MNDDDDDDDDDDDVQYIVSAISYHSKSFVLPVTEYLG
jgi:hypothetical protein